MLLTSDDKYGRIRVTQTQTQRKGNTMPKQTLNKDELEQMVEAMAEAIGAAEIENYEENWEELESDDGHLELYEDEYDGQPSMYEEYQDLHGGDDWDQGQYDE
jgi:hypothetical protein